MFRHAIPKTEANHVEHDYSSSNCRGPFKVHIIDERKNFPISFTESYNHEDEEDEEILDEIVEQQELPPWMCKEEIVVTDPISKNDEYLLIDNDFLEEQEMVYHQYRPLPKRRKRKNRSFIASEGSTYCENLDWGINRIICRLCGMVTQANLRKMHVYRYHLNRPLYECTFCEHSSTYHVSNVKTHMRIHHGVPNRMAKPINRKDEFDAEIAAFMHRCFADNRMFTRTVPQSVKDVVETLVSSVSDAQSATVRGECTSRPRLHGNDDLDVTCNLCGMTNIKQRGRHVLQHHVKKPVFRCPHCDYSTNYASSSIKDHLRSQHPEEPSAKPLDFRWNYQNLIDHYFSNCFY